jgi:predicted oxidoreductase (fatty acid repression mutant protein)
MKETFEQAMKNRRTVYAIGRGSLIKEKIFWRF